jgi:molybdopterin-guanine dinucleotide biosynthesis protein A
MAYADKGLLCLHNHPLMEYVLQRFRPQVAKLFISANRNIERYQQYGLAVIADEDDSFSGPLAGLLRVMQLHPTSPVVLVPCDAPQLPRNLVSRLIDAATADCLAVIPHDGERLQPLFGLYAPVALASLQTFMGSGQRKVTDWVTSLEPIVVDFSDQANAFLNINTPEELADLEATTNN